MIACTSCGRENEDDYKFCLGCGSSLPRPQAKPAQPQMMGCPHCGTLVPAGFKFCGACGGSLPGEAPAPAPAPAVSAPISAFDPGSSGSAGLSEPSIPSYGAAEATSALHSGALAAGAPPLPEPIVAGARLVVIRPDGSEAATLDVHEPEFIVGREGTHPVLTEDLFLSPQHAVIAHHNGKYTISDNDSLNGIYIRLRAEVELQHGDLIRVGQELLEFHLMDQVRPDDEAPAEDRETLRGGSPDVGYWGRLALVSGPNSSSRAYVFSEDQIELGRERGDILFQDDGFVSGRHARISKTEGKVILKDLGSSNGTYIRIRQARDIIDGDLLLMGQQLFRFTL